MLEKSNDAGELKIIEGFVPKELSLGKVFAAEDDKNFKLAMKLLFEFLSNPPYNPGIETIILLTYFTDLMLIMDLRLKQLEGTG